jgi:hypothetical protein
MPKYIAMKESIENTFPHGIESNAVSMNIAHHQGSTS